MQLVYQKTRIRSRKRGVHPTRVHEPTVLAAGAVPRSRVSAPHQENFNQQQDLEISPAAALDVPNALHLASLHMS
ncbi:hypothetical protein C0J50_15112 [Silurus asotus]|uniref:Uncharacterized protein n=1 Tax=Silurus asotus TaxID=30991 RepID=A0AAD5AYA6_SILAS|nr:hypothetical protein C0J50_15112 [Silurus asotus]